MKAKLTMYKHIGKLCEPNNGYIKEFNLVSWNNREPVYDIRTWNEDHTEWKEGAVITHNEMFKFQKLLTDYLNSENKYEKFPPVNEKIEQEESLREAYIRFVSKLKNGFFDEGLYNTFFEKLNEGFEQWKKNGAVSMRVFEVCIDCIYVLSKNALNLSEKDLEKSKAAKDDVYGLLMGFE